jgi:hypothetical protein
MAEQFLNRPDVISFLQEVGGKTVPQRVHRGLFGISIQHNNKFWAIILKFNAVFNIQ